MQTSRLTLLRNEVARVLNASEVPVDVGMGELGIDSLNVVELVLACEQIYAAQVSPDELKIDQYTTLEELHNQLERCIACSQAATA